jgi:uncharacterized membrane protein
LIVDRKLDFWTALEVSRRVITAQWWRVLGLVLLGVVFALLGVIALIIGIFVALPLFYGALVYAYEDLCGPPANGCPGRLRHDAGESTLRACESLKGPRPPQFD